MFFTERFPVLHEAFVAGAEDAQGVPVGAWAEPVTRQVITVYPVDATDLIRDEQSGMMWHLNMLTLTAWTHNKDRITYKGEVYTVVGEPDDYTAHPWGFHGGYRTRLRAVRG